MRRILLCTGILGGGTALTFAAAALAATLLPGGTVIPASNMRFGDMTVGGSGVMAQPLKQMPVQIGVDANGGATSDAGSPAPAP